jgi:hypothetical protein
VLSLSADSLKVGINNMQTYIFFLSSLHSYSHYSYSLYSFQVWDGNSFAMLQSLSSFDPLSHCHFVSLKFDPRKNMVVFASRRLVGYKYVSSNKTSHASHDVFRLLFSFFFSFNDMNYLFICLMISTFFSPLIFKPGLCVHTSFFIRFFLFNFNRSS